jgi:hypothetical protein
MLGPTLAAPIVAYLGGYTTLFAAVAAVTTAGSILVTRTSGPSPDRAAGRRLGGENGRTVIANLVRPTLNRTSSF